LLIGALVNRRGALEDSKISFMFLIFNSVKTSKIGDYANILPRIEPKRRKSSMKV
jgi:hypothetical protein